MKITDLKIAVARKRLPGLTESDVAEGKNLKMGIILDASGEDSLQAFKKLRADLNLEQKDVKLVICGKRSAESDLFEAPVLSLKDLDWKGKLPEAASDFLNAYYDVLISFTATENKMAAFLVSVSRARLKVGRKIMDKNDIFDLTISAELSESEIFTTELKKYLNILNTTEA